MKKPTLMLGAGALAVLVVAVALSLRPGSDPVAAQQPTPMPPPAPASAGPAVARLGNQQIDLAELKSVLASLPAESREQLRANRGALETWLRSRLAQKAVLEQADAQGWRQRPEVEQQTRAAAEQIVFRDYMLSVSQIFLAVNDPQNLDAVRRQAQDLSRRAQATPGDFAALATQFSQDTDSAARGGDSGMQPLQQLVPEVRSVVSRLKVGAVSDVVQSAAGFHVLKLTGQQPARSATLDELRERLTQALRAQRQEQIAKAYLEGMLNTATLSIDGAELNKVLE